MSDAGRTKPKGAKRGRPAKAATAPDYQQTSLRIDRAVYRRAWGFKLDTGRDLGEIVSRALDDYLKANGR
ncbi:MAG TPA: hypothetical protein VJ735_05940 [Actinomycetes bacterium]|nr:hypothetical protein [Actinomycetes bacterium]